MKKVLISLVAFAMGTTAFAAAIEQVIVRQQWPWSTDVKVEYRLSDVSSSAPVDIQVAAFNGDVALPSAQLEGAISGTRFALSEGGVYNFVIDPVKAFGTNKVALTDFKVRLTAVASTQTEVLYKVVKIADGSVTDITRADLLNGKFGTVETDYSVFGDGYTTTLSDVLVWTGVTNKPMYKTTHVVLRKIPAGSMKPTVYYPGTATANITSPYWIGVFEFTQAQWNEAGYAGARPNYDENAYVAEAPANRINNYRLFSDGNKRTPQTVNNCLFGCLTNRTGLAFTLPTCQQWMKAAGGGNDTYFYTGLDMPSDWAKNDQADVIGHYSGNGSGIVAVGSYVPNAYGLYDTFGNVAEMCRDALPGGNADMTDDYLGTIGNTVAVLGGHYLGGSKFCPEKYSDIGKDTPKRDYQMNSSSSYNPECGFRVMLPDSAFAQE